MAFDVAQVCLNGHVVNPSSTRHPESNENFCSRCGAKTITRCDDCGTVIRGTHHGMVSYIPDRASYCAGCGKPYAWTVNALGAAADLSDELELSEEDKHVLKTALPDLVSDNARTTVAASRFKRIVNKAGPVAAEAFKSILINVVTEAAKKGMFPGS